MANSAAERVEEMKCASVAQLIQRFLSSENTMAAYFDALAASAILHLLVLSFYIYISIYIYI